MGTRFVATQEAPVHQNVKQQIVDNDERATQIVFRKWGNTARVALNEVSAEIARIEAHEGTTFEDVAALAAGVRGRTNVLTEGKMDEGMWWASQAQGLINDIPSVRELVAKIMADAEAIIGRNHAALSLA